MTEPVLKIQCVTDADDTIIHAYNSSKACSMPKYLNHFTEDIHFYNSIYYLFADNSKISYLQRCHSFTGGSF